MAPVWPVLVPPGLVLVTGGHRSAPAGRRLAPAARGPSLFPAAKRSSHVSASRAVSGSGNCGTPAVLGVRLDGLDHQVEFIGAIDLSRNAVVLTRCGSVGFSEVMQPINTVCGVISHEQDGTGAVFHPQEQEQVIGAEVEHCGRGRRAGAEAPAPIGSAVEGLPGGLLQPGYRHSAAHDRSRRVTQPAMWKRPWLCAGCHRRVVRSPSFRRAGPQWRWRWWY